MALSIDEANAVSSQYFDKTSTQQAYQADPFLAVLRSKNRFRVEGGNQIQVPMRYKKLGNSGFINPDDQVTFKSLSTRTALVLDWTWARGDTMITWKERTLNTNGRAQTVDLMKDKAAELIEDMDDILATAIHATSQAANNPVPLAVIVDSADTYGGVAVADATEWAGVEDSSSVTLTLALLRSLRNDATFGKNMPTMHLTTRDLLSKYESLLDPHMVYEDKNMANLGFDSVSFYRKPVVSSPYTTAKYWYGLDMDTFSLIIHKDDSGTNGISISDWKDLTVGGYPDSFGKVASWRGNLLCRRRKTNFKLSALVSTN